MSKTKKVKPTKFEKLLEKKILEWEDSSTLSEKEQIDFFKINSEKYSDALALYMSICCKKGDPFEANDAMIKYMRNNDDIKTVISLYADLYAMWSDTPDEALWATSLLNEIENDNINLIKQVIHLYTQAEKKEQSLELYEKAKEKFPDQFSEIDDMTAYMYSELPEYIKKGEELVRSYDIKNIDKLDPTSISVGSLKFYAGCNHDGLVYHFGGEDLRPNNFVSKKEIPNHTIADFNNKSVVITPYRGMGDSMILSRFIPKFIAKWPDVKLYIATEHSMIPLYKNMSGIKSVGTVESFAGKMFDYCLGVNMLSRYLREQLVDEEGRIPYHEWVAYPEFYNDKWKDTISKDKPVVGINWKGSQRLGGTGRSDTNTSRDVPFEEFVNIIDLYPNYTFVCLNQDIADDERESLKKYSNVIIPTPIKDFGDTAALINLCDLVVSIDTSISTLSASMSKDTVVMAKFWPDYRWLHYAKWWDLNKVNIDVYRKERYNASWTQVLFNVVKRLKEL